MEKKVAGYIAGVLIILISVLLLIDSIMNHNILRAISSICLIIVGGLYLFNPKD